MKKFILTAVAALSLSGCGLNNLTSEITPARCEAVIKAANQAEALARFLVSQGVEEHLANQIAGYVAEGRVTVQQVCDALNREPGPDPEPGVVPVI